MTIIDYNYIIIESMFIDNNITSLATLAGNHLFSLVHYDNMLYCFITYWMVFYCNFIWSLLKACWFIRSLLISVVRNLFFFTYSLWYYVVYFCISNPIIFFAISCDHNWKLFHLKELHLLRLFEFCFLPDCHEGELHFEWYKIYQL